MLEILLILSIVRLIRISNILKKGEEAMTVSDQNFISSLEKRPSKMYPNIAFDEFLKTKKKTYAILVIVVGVIYVGIMAFMISAMYGTV